MKPLHPTHRKHLHLYFFATALWAAVMGVSIFTGWLDHWVGKVIVLVLCAVVAGLNIRFWWNRILGKIPNFPDPKRHFLLLSVGVGLAIGTASFFFMQSSKGMILFPAILLLIGGTSFIISGNDSTYFKRNNLAHSALAILCVLCILALILAISHFNPQTPTPIVLPVAILHTILSILPFFANYALDQQNGLPKGKAAGMELAKQLQYFEESINISWEDLKAILPKLAGQNPVWLYPHLKDQQKHLPTILIQFPAKIQADLLNLKSGVQQQLADWEAEMGGKYHTLNNLWCTHHEIPCKFHKWNQTYRAECDECRSGKYVIHNITSIRGVLYTPAEKPIAPVAELQIWDEQAKKIIPRAINELKISAGEHLSHDWFVTAFCNWLNQSPPKVPILVLQEPGLHLSENARRMLEAARQKNWVKMSSE